MGSPISPLFSDSVMEDLETTFLKLSQDFHDISTLFYYCYVDDTIMSMKTDSIHLVVNIFNSYASHSKCHSNGLPPHKLMLKVGAIVILLRNMNIEKGLCNGTRLMIERFFEYTIEVKILTGNKKGEKFLLPRIDLSPSIEEIPFKMIRRQFPIRLGFAMTINKSQGQSFNKVGVYLPNPVFSHGQLYVALSRVTNKKNLRILLSGKSSYKNNNKNKEKKRYSFYKKYSIRRSIL